LDATLSKGSTKTGALPDLRYVTKEAQPAAETPSLSCALHDGKGAKEQRFLL